MITDKLLDEMPFRDVTEIMILDNEQNNANNNNIYYVQYVQQ